ncbi:MAG: DinB family protein [Fimbriimonas sp.]
MRLQEYIVRATQKALDDVERAALATPDDRRAWSPGGQSRSVLGQMQELARAATWLLPIIEHGQVPNFDNHARREAEEALAFDTVEECIQAARESTSELCRAILETPDEDLEEEIKLPFGGGMILTLAEVIDLHRWNLIYHLGQINQIQLIIGDGEMH